MVKLKINLENRENFTEITGKEKTHNLALNKGNLFF
jgi:hypothetical protein